MRSSIPCTFSALALVVLFPACYSTAPIYESSVPGPAEATEYRGPAWGTSINWFGWGVVLAATGGGAYAGYESGIALEWSSGEPAREEPIANAALAGASAGLSVMILNALFKPETPVYRADDASGWLAALDERMVLVETGTRRVTVTGSYSSSTSQRNVPTILALDQRAERTLLPNDTTELKIFLTAFPTSERRDSVGLHAVGTFDRDHLPFIVAKYGEAPPAQEAKRRYAVEAPSLSEAIRVAERYPEVGDVAEERGVEFVGNQRDAVTFIKAFPESEAIDDIVVKILPSMRSSEVRALLPHITGTVTRSRLGQALLDSATSVTEILDLLESFPTLRPLAEPRAASVARTTTDFRTFLTTFPESDAAPDIRKKLMEKLRVPENLGTGVNSDASEYKPTITPDGSTLYFVRRYTYDNTGTFNDEDIWVSESSGLDRWSSARNLSELNTWNSNGVLSVTPDGNTLLVHGDYSSDEIGSTSASLTHRTRDGWSTPEPLRIRDYHNRGSYMQTFLANDGQTIILALNRRGGRGEHDLYISFQEDDGRWTAPKNLGSTINTREHENAPFLASDGVTLYFASGGHGGEGGQDIYMSRRLDDSWSRWSKPVNLGPPINTENDDAFFFIPASGDVAYFSSDASGEGLSDIFRVALPDDRRPLPVVLVSGIVRDRSTGEPIEAEIIYENLATGKEVGRARTDPSTGLYKLTLPPGAVYGFRAEAGGFMAIADNLDLSDLTVYREQSRDLELVPIRVGESIRLNNLFFDVGRASLRPESYPELNRLAEIMKDRPGLTIEVTGHTDSVGTAEDNLRLSRERAEAVAGYLGKKGVGGSRATTIGRGEEEPVAPNDNDDGRALNRRVEVRITGE